MIYIHYCSDCSRFHMLNGHKNLCPVCNHQMIEAKMPFVEFSHLTHEEREQYKQLIIEEACNA